MLITKWKSVQKNENRYVEIVLTENGAYDSVIRRRIGIEKTKVEH